MVTKRKWNGNQNQAIIQAEISFNELLDTDLFAMLYCFSQSVSCHNRTWLVPRQMDGLLKFAIGLEGLFSFNHKESGKSQCSGEIWNKWNISSTSHIAARSSCWRQTGTPSKVFLLRPAKLSWSLKVLGHMTISYPSPMLARLSEFRLSVQVISPRSLADPNLGRFGLILFSLIQALGPTVLPLGHS